MTNPPQEFTITLDDVRYRVVAEGDKIKINDRPFAVEAREDGTVLVDGIAYEVTLKGDQVDAAGVLHTVDVDGLSLGPRSATQPADTLVSARDDLSDGAVVAIMPGKVTRVLVAAGQEVREGQPVCVLEAMKMENELRADRDGIVNRVHVEPGDDVEKGQVLVDLT